MNTKYFSIHITKNFSRHYCNYIANTFHPITKQKQNHMAYMQSSNPI
jgi:hypothetical protein